MGMDICGKQPTTEEGKYFCNNIWWWRPLADYVCEIAPEIADKCQYWQSNDGDGLNGHDSLRLAELLQKEIESGRTAAYARRREAKLEMAPNEPCLLCEATGTRKPPPDGGAGDLADYIISLCKDTIPASLPRRCRWRSNQGWRPLQHVRRPRIHPTLGHQLSLLYRECAEVRDLPERRRANRRRSAQGARRGMG